MRGNFAGSVTLQNRIGGGYVQGCFGALTGSVFGG